MKLQDLIQKIAPLPWKLEGTAITDGGPNIIAACSKGWSDDKANTAYLHHAANVLPDLVDAADRANCECTLKERNSGHLSGCWMPALEEALAKAFEVEMENKD